MILSETGRGKIYAGNSRLASSLIVRETGAMELTISSGTFTSTGDVAAGIPAVTYYLNEPAICPIFNDTDSEKCYQAQLITSQWGTEIAWSSSYPTQPDIPPLPAGYEAVHFIVFPFTVPPLTQSVRDIAIYVLTVLPNFPEGIDGESWDGRQIQLIGTQP